MCSGWKALAGDRVMGAETTWLCVSDWWFSVVQVSNSTDAVLVTMTNVSSGN